MLLLSVAQSMSFTVLSVAVNKGPLHLFRFMVLVGGDFFVLFFSLLILCYTLALHKKHENLAFL